MVLMLHSTSDGSGMSVTMELKLDNHFPLRFLREQVVKNITFF